MVNELSHFANSLSKILIFAPAKIIKKKTLNFIVKMPLWAKILISITTGVIIGFLVSKLIYYSLLIF